jgi:hypothetical protein
MKGASIIISILSAVFLVLGGCGKAEEQAERLFEQGRYEKIVKKFPDLSITKEAKEKAAERLLLNGKFRDALKLYPESRLSREAKRRLDKQIADSLLARKDYSGVLNEYADTPAAESARNELAAQLYDRKEYDKLVDEYPCSPAAEKMLQERSMEALSEARKCAKQSDRNRALIELVNQFRGTPAVELAVAELRKRPQIHTYQLMVIDSDQNTIGGAKIVCELTERSIPAEQDTFITMANGKLFAAMQATRDPGYHYIRFYSTQFRYSVSKDGYYPETGVLFSHKDSTPLPGDAEKDSFEVVTLLRPIDYFAQTFANSDSNLLLKTMILDTLNMIVIQGFLTNAKLEERSINLITFKEMRYVHFRFSSTVTYNSLKMDKYDIGKRLFDEVVCKILTPLNDLLGTYRMPFGYDLVVEGSTKDFLEKYAPTQTITYRFLIPKQTVVKYKHNDITSQQLLDSSVVLMDDERIELRLQ